MLEADRLTLCTCVIALQAGAPLRRPFRACICNACMHIHAEIGHTRTCKRTQAHTRALSCTCMCHHTPACIHELAASPLGLPVRRLLKVPRIALLHVPRTTECHKPRCRRLRVHALTAGGRHRLNRLHLTAKLPFVLENTLSPMLLWSSSFSPCG